MEPEKFTPIPPETDGWDDAANENPKVVRIHRLFIATGIFCAVVIAVAAAVYFFTPWERLTAGYSRSYYAAWISLILMFFFPMLIGGIICVWIMWVKKQSLHFSHNDKSIHAEEGEQRHSNLKISENPTFQTIFLAIGVALILYGWIGFSFTLPGYLPARTNANQTNAKLTCKIVMEAVMKFKSEPRRIHPNDTLIVPNIVINVVLFCLLIGSGFYCFWESRFRVNQQSENPGRRIKILRITGLIIILSSIIGLFQCLIQIM